MAFQVFCGKDSLWGGIKLAQNVIHRLFKGRSPAEGAGVKYPEVPAQLWPVLDSCWSYDYTKRPVMKQVREAISGIAQETAAEA